MPSPASAATRRPPSFANALREVRVQLRLGQEQLGALAGFSRRSVVRWESGGIPPAGKSLAKLVRAIHARDPTSAARIASAAGASIEEHGLEPSAHAMAVARSALDLAVLSAAEAADLSPRVARPAVEAAFARLVALGVTLESVARAIPTG